MLLLEALEAGAHMSDLVPSWKGREYGAELSSKHAEVTTTYIYKGLCSFIVLERRSPCPFFRWEVS